ncbi:MAG TPA: MotA/TolQ/ExbB proton channel family protein [Anaeromyxobacteraceae bacterium]|nr:MotA/TolQ/ExbB proton channel family protein [Anaeromyxobacteraceae bacterium]
MLTQKLLSITSHSAEWVLWLLAVLSFISVGIMLERALFFASRRLGDPDRVRAQLLAGDFAAAGKAVENMRGMEAEVVRAAVSYAPKGSESVAEVVNAEIARSRLEYEQRLAFLGTLGNNAPFIGLLGTVLGVIRAFADLAAHPGAGGAGSVMAGISEALVATAVGLVVALPAVVMFNFYQRRLRCVVQRASVLAHSIIAYLEAKAEKG